MYLRQQDFLRIKAVHACVPCSVRRVSHQSIQQCPNRPEYPWRRSEWWLAEGLICLCGLSRSCGKPYPCAGSNWEEDGKCGLFEHEGWQGEKSQVGRHLWVGAETVINVQLTAALSYTLICCLVVARCVERSRHPVSPPRCTD